MPTPRFHQPLPPDAGSCPRSGRLDPTRNRRRTRLRLAPVLLLLATTLFMSEQVVSALYAGIRFTHASRTVPFLIESHPPMRYSNTRLPTKKAERNTSYGPAIACPRETESPPPLDQTEKTGGQTKEGFRPQAGGDRVTSRPSLHGARWPSG